MTAAALFLLHRYMVGVAKGLGVESLGQKHATAAAKFFAAIRSKAPDQPKLDESERDSIESLAEDFQTFRLDAHAREGGRDSVLKSLLALSFSKNHAEAVGTLVDEALMQHEQ